MWNFTCEPNLAVYKRSEYDIFKFNGKITSTLFYSKKNFPNFIVSKSILSSRCYKRIKYQYDY